MNRATLLPTAPPRRVVVGVDGSAASTDALRWAARVAEEENAVLDVVATWPWPGDRAGAAAASASRQDVEGRVSSSLAEVFGGRAPARLRTRVVPGDPADALLAAADGAHMLVVVDSVGARLATRATCPVLVTHGRPPR